MNSPKGFYYYKVTDPTTNPPTASWVSMDNQLCDCPWSSAIMELNNTIQTMLG